MASTQLQMRRGTASQCNAMTPAEGEVIVNLTNDRLQLGDGLVAGGIPHINYKDAQNNPFTHATSGGSANALTLTLAGTPSGYGSGFGVSFIAGNSNTGAATIDVNGMGAQNIYKLSSGTLTALAAGDIIAGGAYELLHNGTQFQIMGLQSGGLTLVKQGDLSTSLGTISSSLQTQSLVLPGGEYGFYPQIYNSTASPVTTFAAMYARLTGSALGAVVGNDTGIIGVTPQAIISLGNQGGGGVTTYANQRYILSSPPFDLGDGEVAGFIYALVNSAGDVVSTYAAEVPPWAYNGPTDIRATHHCKVTGKKFRRRMVGATLDDIMDRRDVRWEQEEITHKLKNKDMAIIPHPFINVPAGHTVVLIDPMDEQIMKLISYQNAGGNISDALHQKITIDSECLKRKGPKGVGIHKMKWKSSR